VYRLLSAILAIVAAALATLVMAAPASATNGPFTNFHQAADSQYDDDDRCDDDDDDDGDRRGRECPDDDDRDDDCDDDDRGDRDRRGRGDRGDRDRRGRRDRDRGDRDECDDDDDRRRHRRDRDDDDDDGDDDRDDDSDDGDGDRDDDSDDDGDDDGRDAPGNTPGTTQGAAPGTTSGTTSGTPSGAGPGATPGNTLALTRASGGGGGADDSQVAGARATSGGNGGAAGDANGSAGVAGATGSGIGDIPVIVFLSPTDPTIVSGVTSVFRSLGEPQTEILNLIEPVNLAALRRSAGAGYGSLTPKRLSLISQLGRKIGRQIPRRSVFFDAIGPITFSGILPTPDRRFVVFARTGGRLDAQATKIRNAFEKGLARGVRLTKVPVAGVEAVTTQPSQIKWFKRNKLSSVDNIDTLNGQRALRAILLRQAKGHFGVKATAARLLPNSVKLSPTAAAINSQKGDFDSGVGISLIIVLFGGFVAWTTLRVVSRMRAHR
jgi:hypothetical protein